MMNSLISPTRLMLATAVAALMVAPATVHAQAKEEPTEERANARVWGISTPAGSYNVRIDHISSVSSTEYLIEGNIMVYEVTVDTIGQTTARFYYGEPFVPKTNLGTTEALTNRAREIADNASSKVADVSGQVDRLVIKSYGIPNTTHAKTIEFKVASRQELSQIYKSVKDSWLKGRGRNLRVKDD